MGHAIRRIVIPATCALVTMFVSGTVHTRAGETVTLRLRSGRTFTASLDARSNETRLWLRFGSDSMIILRPVEWDAVVGASMDENEVSVSALREIVQAMDPLEIAPPALLGRLRPAAPGVRRDLRRRHAGIDPKPC